MSTLKVDSLVEKTSGNGVHIPGHVVQFAQATLSNSTTWSQSNTRAALYGTGRVNRAYIEAVSLTITPKSTSSILYCTANIGWDQMNASGTQAHGSIITLNDTTSINITRYPWYPGNSWSSNSTPYWPSEQVIGTFSPNSTSVQTIRLRPFIYWEGGTASAGYVHDAKLFVMEIAQ
jgi:hypothetical protein